MLCIFPGFDRDILTEGGDRISEYSVLFINVMYCTIQLLLFIHYTKYKVLLCTSCTVIGGGELVSLMVLGQCYCNTAEIGEMRVGNTD